MMVAEQRNEPVAASLLVGSLLASLEFGRCHPRGCGVIGRTHSTDWLERRPPVFVRKVLGRPSSIARPVGALAVLRRCVLLLTLLACTPTATALPVVSSQLAEPTPTVVTPTRVPPTP